MIEDLKQNIKKLIALYEAERQRSGELSAKISRCEEDIVTYKEQIDDLKRQIDNLRLSAAFNPAGPTAESKARLDKVIAEIDKCINLLEN